MEVSALIAVGSILRSNFGKARMRTFFYSQKLICDAPGFSSPQGRILRVVSVCNDIHSIQESAFIPYRTQTVLPLSSTDIAELSSAIAAGG